MKQEKVILIFVSIFLSLCVSSQAQNNTLNQLPFIPLAVGNYWIYSNSRHPDKPDTVRIVKTEVTDYGTRFQFTGHTNLGGISLERNDSLFSFQRDRGSENSFPCLEFFPSDTEIVFGIVIGGDVVSSRRVSKIKGTYKINGKEYSDCYQFSESLDGELEYTVICRGVGIIKIQYSRETISLVDYKIR